MLHLKLQLEPLTPPVQASQKSRHFSVTHQPFIHLPAVNESCATHYQHNLNKPVMNVAAEQSSLLQQTSEFSNPAQSDLHKTIVILGATRGIGKGLANEFLKMNHNVMITGQTPKSVQGALTELSRDPIQAADNLKGATCDLNNLAHIQSVWDNAYDSFGRVDYWITCAGISQPMTNPDDRLKRLVDMQPESYKEVIDVNLIGAMNSAKVAIPAMEAQGQGHFYLFEGFGSDGTIRSGLTPYGTSKVGVEYLTKALAQEAQESNSPVKVGSLSPGIVNTHLLKAPYVNNPAAWEKDKKIYNILADEVEPVAAFLAQAVLKNTTNGKSIQWLTPLKAISRFLTAPFIKRNDF